ncbi:sigma-54-dependent Fis family transcriptional regulator [bacterium]|nr:sigma-54-dependent Fis family transcriptional regulator [bacterium]
MTPLVLLGSLGTLEEKMRVWKWPCEKLSFKDLSSQGADSPSRLSQVFLCSLTDLAQVQALNLASSRVLLVIEENEMEKLTLASSKGFRYWVHQNVALADFEAVVKQLFDSLAGSAELDYHRRRDIHTDISDEFEFRSSKMNKLVQELERAALTKTTILIEGETGVGKSHLAKWLHSVSPRRKGPFISLHCGVVSDELVESELFGHEKGAFTGAVKKKLGRFELAESGTIFLDEVSTLSASAQIKLLQVLQDSSFQRVGGEQDVSVDVRVIAATNERLKDLVQVGKFREDLYYRLNVFSVLIPPLRQRLEDVELLVKRSLENINAKYGLSFTGVEPSALAALKLHAWPGNIRELQNVIERASILEKSNVITLESLPSDLVEQVDTEGRPKVVVDIEKSLADSRSKVIEDFERQYLTGLLEKTNGSIQNTAMQAKVGVRQLHKLLSKYQIKKELYK